jgi:glycosyltransferase involved in cell wall biosynthesis
MDKEFTKLPVVCIAAPCRNRSWVILRYLDGILNLNYPKDKLILYWLVNDSTDQTLRMLQDFQQLHKHEYRDIQIERIKTKAQEYKRTISKPPQFAEKYWQEVYLNIAKLRNKVIDKVLETNSDYWFSVDSDIILNDPETLNILLSEAKPIISAIINNDQIRNPHLLIQQAACNILNFDERGKVKHITGWEMNSTFQIQITGAVCLYKSEIFKNPNIRFGYSRMGEDIFFAQRVLEAGIETWTTSKVLPEHCMGLMQPICEKCDLKCKRFSFQDGERKGILVTCLKFKEKI